ncbi:MAG: FimB/Mfa2 family fimbrial subunit [Bacteroidales bacterium]|nr:FimB/Mfa2 family fimbrial subunit [Bacteroidales bacterium]
MNRVHIFRRIVLALSMVAAALAASSCQDGFIFEGEGDCGTYYRIRFRYDYNIKFADAFAAEVNSIALYVFDENDILVEEIATTDKKALSSGKFEIPLELEPGKYTLMAWGGLMNEESFDMLADTKVGVTKREELQVRMHRQYDENGEARVSEDLLPLYHGTMSLEVKALPGTFTETMSLKKNTNVIRILLHEMSGHDVDADKFIFEINDSNGLYDCDNNLLDDEMITYSAWHQSTGSADVDDMDVKAVTSVSVALAELTIGRMRAGDSPVLHIKDRETGEDVFRIPVADYALLVKGYYRQGMGDQEYLDRQDEYTMTFFLDEGKWVSSVIYINSWRVVLNNSELN